MFVHYFTHVPINMGDVERRIDELRAQFQELAHVAYREGEALRAKVGPSPDGYAKEVEMEIGVPEIHRIGLVYPVRWAATGATSLFPRLTGELILSHEGANNTKLSFEATYKPPLGAVGKMADRVLLGKIAEATIKNWVDGLAAALGSSDPPR